jgi:hypothetical protein
MTLTALAHVGTSRLRLVRHGRALSRPSTRSAALRLLQFGGEVIFEGAALGRGVEVARRREMGYRAGLSCPTSLAQGMSIAA